VLTAYALAWLSIHDLSLHLFGIWLIPAGAILSGSAATSGCYAAARILGRCPGIRTFLGMVPLSALAYVAIYYFEFRMRVVKDTHIERRWR
jgi:hypothetical protein